MRIRISHLAVLIAAAVALLGSARAQDPAKAPKPLRAELAVDYTFVRSNAPPGSCDCFSLNGGGVSFAWPVKPNHFALAGDMTFTHAGSITGKGYDLTLSSYTAGAKYLIPMPHDSHLQPFAQALVGVAHASGSLVEGRTPAANNAGAAFAAHVGGGLDLRLARRYSLRLIEADYMVTTIDNGVNDHQNNFRISAGVVFHF